MITKLINVIVTMLLLQLATANATPLYNLELKSLYSTFPDDFQREIVEDIESNTGYLNSDIASTHVTFGILNINLNAHTEQMNASRKVFNITNKVKDIIRNNDFPIIIALNECRSDEIKSGLGKAYLERKHRCVFNGGNQLSAECMANQLGDNYRWIQKGEIGLVYPANQFSLNFPIAKSIGVN